MLVQSRPVPDFRLRTRHVPLTRSPHAPRQHGGHLAARKIQRSTVEMPGKKLLRRKQAQSPDRSRWLRPNSGSVRQVLLAWTLGNEPKLVGSLSRTFRFAPAQQ